MNHDLAPSRVPLDHVIFYAGYHVDELAAFFEQVGFTLTPPGRHNSGSINRLAMLEDQYLEIMGFAEGTPPTVRPELQAMPLGLNGIVAADRPDQPRRSPPEGFLPAVHLERPVSTPQAQGIASFAITNVRDPAPDVRVFLCRHHTPELVWQPHWQRHANAATAVTEVRIATRDPARLHAGLRKVFDIEGHEGATAYDAAGSRVHVLAPGERPSVTVRTADAAAAGRVVRACGVAHTAQAGRIVVPLPQRFPCDLVFGAAA